MNRFWLSDDEIASIRLLLKDITSRYKSVEDEELLDDICLYAHELPRGVRSFLNDFKLREPSPGCCIISGYPVDQEKIGPTPAHWKDRPELSPTLDEEVYLLLCGSLLGESLGWATQQDGHIVHDVMPIKGHEYEQLGTGSQELLWWHNEDAFHPFRGDYLVLFCLRNPDEVATIFAGIDSVQLSGNHLDILLEPHFTIRPDESHQQKIKVVAAECSRQDQSLLEASYAGINKMNTNPEKLAVLYGDRKSPYIRLDPYFMDRLEENETAQDALDDLIRAIDSNLKDLILMPGDCLIIDNFRAVHGRRPFKAKFDGNDRWLKRINVTRDIRKSRSVRFSPSSRVIY